MNNDRNQEFKLNSLRKNNETLDDLIKIKPAPEFKQAREDINKLAEMAYNAYGNTTNFKNYKGELMPKYSELPEDIKTAWVAAANMVSFMVK